VLERDSIGTSNRRAAAGRILFRASGIAVVVLALLGCDMLRPRNEYLTLDADATRWREAETRRVIGVPEDRLLAASGSTLQDLGFVVRRTHAEVGLLMASKRGSAVQPLQIAGYIAIGLILGDAPAWDDEQEIRASLLIMPEGSDVPGSFRVRLTLQREIFNYEGQSTRIEPVHDSDIFQRFFDMLDSSLFYEQERL
jgi:hypothetical protein